MIDEQYINTYIMFRKTYLHIEIVILCFVKRIYMIDELYINSYIMFRKTYLHDLSYI